MSRSLFLRVFLWFWGGSLTLLLLLTGYFLTAEPDIPTWRRLARTAMADLGSGVAATWEQEGPGAASTALRDLAVRGGTDAWLFSAASLPLAASAPAGDEVMALARQVAASRAEGETSGERRLVARPVATPSGRRCVFVWQAPRPWREAAGRAPGRAAGRLLSLLAASAIACAALTWQIVGPVRALQEAARDLAAGNLAARVSGRRALRRRDELGTLAREFDGMASRLEGAFAAQQRLLADISHELRSPLARLSLALDLARRRVADPVPEHDRIALELGRLDGLIGQLLTMARLGQPAGIDPEPLDLVRLVREVADDATFEGGPGGHAVQVEAPTAVPVVADPRVLRGAIDNVVRNALAYGPAGSPVQVAVQRPEHDAHRVVVTVRDRGPGVPEPALSRLGDPFFRVDESRERTTGGVGLGLTIAREAMRAHGGSLTASNHPAGGLVVALELPVGDDGAPTERGAGTRREARPPVTGREG